tara:strand:+ start:2436 stop:2582 length:147 start_codon:yes stop_codon:yes gene_type:complete
MTEWASKSIGTLAKLLALALAYQVENIDKQFSRWYISWVPGQPLSGPG